jgi:hypothetical protein
MLRSLKKMDLTEKKLANSMLINALDHEGIYTILDTLKPMSSVQFFRMPLYSNDLQQKDSAQKAVELIQKVVNKLSVDDFKFVLNPFERIDSIYRNMEVYVFRKSRLQSLLKTHAAFYQPLGMSPEADPASVIAITEFEKKYDRWRSYGYLFGYPDNAVDFFVEAGRVQDSTGVFVKRDFFAIPVYAGDKGHFTYAIPKGYKPSETDSVIYYKAIVTLQKYKRIRGVDSLNHLNPRRILRKF